MRAATAIYENSCKTIRMHYNVKRGAPASRLTWGRPKELLRTSHPHENLGFRKEESREYLLDGKMSKRGLSQERLKRIACICMLLDHIGAIILADCIRQATGAGKDLLQDIYEMLRLIGRPAFPIFCFLLVEGHVHTRNPKRYALRLLMVAVLSEFPYDLALYGGINWQHQSVMVTLLLGLALLEVMKKCAKLPLRLLAILAFAVLASLLQADYSANGILTIALFALTRGLPYAAALQFFGLWCIFSPHHLMMLNWVGGFSVTVQELAVLAVVPIALYDGRKATKSKAVQWSFYLFYPVHLFLLFLIGCSI